MVKEKLEEILSKMEDIKYGFADGTDNIYPDDDKDWDAAAERYVQTFIDRNNIPQVNDIEIEEVWHN